MYLLYRIENSQVEMKISTDTFLKVVDSKVLKIISLLDKSKSNADDFKIHPETTSEAKWMIRAYCFLNKSNLTIPKWLEDYFCASFENILNGTPPAKSLGLTRSPHRPKESYIAERNEAIYSDVLSLMQSGISLLNASLDMSEKYKLHESNIQKIYSSLKKAKKEYEDLGEILNEEINF